jgi:large subunit ribosomal protein L24
MHVRKGDEVLVIAGKEKGHRGKITAALPKKGRVIVQGLNMIIRHMKPRGQGKSGGRIEMEAPIAVSNVMLICPNCGRASRTGKRFEEELDHKGRPRKVRYCKACEEAIPEPKA